VAPQLPVPTYLQGLQPLDKFRPMHLRSMAFDPAQTRFSLLLDQGDNLRPSTRAVTDATAKVMEYFQIGLRLPNNSFWVNLRPDSSQRVIDPDLERTDLGKVFLEADLQLKKDLAQFTAPATPAGKMYWKKLYARAESLFGQEDVTIPTMTRPWIIPGEIIIKQQGTSAYVYKATMRVMLEQDYISSRDGAQTPAALATAAAIADPRMKELNAYSTQLIKDLVLPRLNREVNASRRYAGLRQAFYSLVLAQWFKTRIASAQVGESEKTEHGYAQMKRLIDSRDLTGLISKQPCPTQDYYRQYRKSFEQGEYKKEEALSTPHGMVIRRYTSGGIFGAVQPQTAGVAAETDVLAVDPVTNGIGYDPATGAIDINPEGLINGQQAEPQLKAQGPETPDGGSLSRELDSILNKDYLKRSKILMLRKVHKLSDQKIVEFVQSYYRLRLGQTIERLKPSDARTIADVLVRQGFSQYKAQLRSLQKEVRALERPSAASRRVGAPGNGARAARVLMAMGLVATAAGVGSIVNQELADGQGISDLAFIQDQLITLMPDAAQDLLTYSPFAASAAMIDTSTVPYGGPSVGWASEVEPVTMPADVNDKYLNVVVKANGQGKVRFQLLDKNIVDGTEAGLSDYIDVQEGENKIAIPLSVYQGKGVNTAEAREIVMHDGKNFWNQRDVNDPGFSAQFDSYEFSPDPIVQESFIDAIIKFFSNLFSFKISLFAVSAANLDTSVGLDGAWDVPISSGKGWGGAESGVSRTGDAVTVEDSRSQNWASFAVDLGGVDVSSKEVLRLKITGTGGEKIAIRVIDGAKDYTSSRGAQRITLKPGENEYTIDLQNFGSDLTKVEQVAFNLGKEGWGGQLNEKAVKITISSVKFDMKVAQVVAAQPQKTRAPAAPTAAVTAAPTPAPAAAYEKYSAEAAAAFFDSTVEAKTGLPASFQPTAEDLAAIHDPDEKRVLEDGLVIYDGAVIAELMVLLGNMGMADKFITVLWENSLPGYQRIVGGYNAGSAGQEFVYDPADPASVSSYEKGLRGWRFKIIDQSGMWEKNGVKWQQWQPIAGENAWVTMAAMQVYHKKYGATVKADATELMLAKELARVAIKMQAGNGGIRMAPIGTWSSQEEPGTPVSEQVWLYNEISTENCISWYGAFRMLFQVTGDQQYKTAMDKLEGYFKSVYDPATGTVAQGMHYNGNSWEKNAPFATDCQTWLIASLGVSKVDAMFGEGASYKMWQKTRETAGVFDQRGNLLGVDFTDFRQVGRPAMVSVEWTAGAITAAREMKAAYGAAYPDRAQSLQKDIDSMRAHVETLKIVRNGVTAYAYSSAYGETGHGWRAAGRMPSSASTGWMAMVDANGGEGFDPFFLGGKSEAAGVPATPGATTAPGAQPTKTPGFSAVAAIAAALGVSSLFAAFRKKQAAKLEIKSEDDGSNDGGLSSTDKQAINALYKKMKITYLTQRLDPAYEKGLRISAIGELHEFGYTGEALRRLLTTEHDRDVLWNVLVALEDSDVQGQEINAAAVRLIRMDRYRMISDGAASFLLRTTSGELVLIDLIDELDIQTREVLLDYLSRNKKSSTTLYKTLKLRIYEPLLKDTKRSVKRRIEAVRKLSNLDSSLYPLYSFKEIIQNPDEDRDVIIETAKSLQGRIPDRELFVPLLRLIRTGDSRVVEKAAALLLHLGGGIKVLEAEFDQGNLPETALRPLVGTIKTYFGEDLGDGGTLVQNLLSRMKQLMQQQAAGTPAAADPVGGIDMRMMPMQQPGVNPAMGAGAAAAAAINPVSLRELDAQWQAIVEQVNQGAVPCKQLQAYMAACATNPQAQDQRKQAEQYLAWVLRLEEDAGVSVSSEMKAAFCGA